MKKFLFFTACLLLLTTLFTSCSSLLTPFLDFNEPNPTEGLILSIGNDGVVGVTRGAAKNVEHIVVPSKINGNTITVIKEFGDSESSSKLKSIKLPKTIKVIGSGAFWECTELSEINIPSGVTEIRGYAFYNCKSLESIELPSTLTTIWYNAFEGSGLKSVTLPSGVKRLYPGAFQNCTALESVTISASTTVIEGWAFKDCSALRTINFNGTEEQLNAIEKDELWDQGAGDYTIIFNYTGN